MHRCENALCGELVNLRRTHHKIGDAYFCTAGCAKQWIETNERLTTAARRFFDQPALSKQLVRERG